ncbi:uncharacterized protein EV422DRAFT_402941 [Fimicolochytrium jonesii]|uniref:uncharacterized protein n=1 Tax=Fimicolochytrium jonesii TaxID=1396493 RepID=UPI0022FEB01B|nr:uncharacterized protein EV422DRAFT_402941 [Fimicolochytrium jonesii]KAI8822535.1 hypothetical protein EV422DRAFT_402941 [Fimicolochytrium jonesii]
MSHHERTKDHEETEPVVKDWGAGPWKGSVVTHLMAGLIAFVDWFLPERVKRKKRGYGHEYETMKALFQARICGFFFLSSMIILVGRSGCQGRNDGCACVQSAVNGFMRRRSGQRPWRGLFLCVAGVWGLGPHDAIYFLVCIQVFFTTRDVWLKQTGSDEGTSISISHHIYLVKPFTRGRGSDAALTLGLSVPLSWINVGRFVTWPT